jgi:hypothetical protein
MSPARELDALVAEKVLGMHVERIRPAWYHGGQEVLCFYQPLGTLMEYSLDADACNAMMFRNGVDERDGIAPPLPFYTGDIAAAWEVVAHMLGNSDQAAYLRFMGLWQQSGVAAPAEIAAERICRAALAAVAIPAP